MEALEFYLPEQLCEYIHNHLIGWDVFNSDLVLINCLANKVKMNIYMLFSGMKVGVFGEVNCTLVVTVKGCWRLLIVEKREFV